MNTKNIIQEQISVFSDGELADGHIDVTLAALRHQDGRAVWDMYHHIGDVLRSDELAFSLRPDFTARMAARLEAEPTVIAPVTNQSQARINQQIISDATNVKGSSIKRLVLSGVAAAVVTAFVFVTAPELMRDGTVKSLSATPSSSTMVASESENRISVSNAPASSGATSKIIGATTVAQNGVILRDPRIDDYLLAHQRFSPSLYSAAQYARSATFATDSNK